MENLATELTRNEPALCASGEGEMCSCHHGIMIYGERYMRTDT